MSERIEVCRAEDLDHLDREIVSVGNTEIGVFNVEGEFYALANTCMHQYGPLCEGDVRPQLEGEHGDNGERVDVQYADGEYRILCPWHNWSYDLVTGVHTGDADIEVPTYDVTVEDGVVYLDV